MREIKIHEVRIEQSDNNRLELLYTPDQTQILRAGKTYKMVIDLSEAPGTDREGVNR